MIRKHVTHQKHYDGFAINMIKANIMDIFVKLSHMEVISKTANGKNPSLRSKHRHVALFHNMANIIMES